MINNNRVVLITGASSGFGKSTALFLNDKGYKVYGTSRNDKSWDYPYPMIKMDVTDFCSIQAGIETIIKKEGHIDVLVNNAGFALAGSLEDTTPEEFHRQIDTNILGVHRLCRSIIPYMRSRKSGMIINISSIAGFMGIPFQGAYSASKCALEGFSESLRMELFPFNIKTVLIEPGDFKTSITANRTYTAESIKGSAYYSSMRQALNVVESDERKGPDPIGLAKLIEKIIKKKNPKVRYLIGPVIEILAVRLKKIIPSRLFQYLLMKYYKS